MSELDRIQSQTMAMLASIEGDIARARRVRTVAARRAARRARRRMVARRAATASCVVAMVAMGVLLTVAWFG